MKLSIDNSLNCSLKSFLRENKKEDVEGLTTNEIKKVRSLEINEYVYKGFIRVKRIK